MADFPILEAVQGFFYVAISVTSLGVMGMTSELCDLAIGDCPGRNIAVIVFAILVFLLALPMFIAYAFELSFLKRIEVFVVLGIFVFNIVETGVASSPRTIVLPFVTELSWWGLLLTLAAFFLALSSGDRPKFELSIKKHDTEAAAEPAAAGYGSQEGTTMSSQPAQPTYTAPPPQPGAVNYTAPPPATK